ncbi:CDP-alcohol phosphatidyltransferase family protein [Microbacterium hominis]|uniref:CDP-alcohol phosphatidyltransferase family protein n=1 Tax=Microbacterium hominis TaxID=162426 RepID=UPI00295EEBCD|nr:CDP-alcohol phosphatidyltransferase family protein [Microbacterium hominis]
MTIAHAYALLGSAQKGRGRGAPAYSLYVNRPVGRVIAAGAYTWGLSPNQVTAVSAVLTFTGVALLALVPPSTALGIGVWLLLAAGYAWDSADGQVARLRGGGSLAGEWLDHVVDAAKLVSLHVAVAIGAFRFFGMPLAWTLVPLGFAIVATVTFFAMILNDLLRARSGVPQAAEAGGSSPLRSVLGLPRRLRRVVPLVRAVGDAAGLRRRVLAARDRRRALSGGRAAGVVPTHGTARVSPRPAGRREKSLIVRGPSTAGC